MGFLTYRPAVPDGIGETHVAYVGDQALTAMRTYCHSYELWRALSLLPKIDRGRWWEFAAYTTDVINAPTVDELHVLAHCGAYRREFADDLYLLARYACGRWPLRVSYSPD